MKTIKNQILVILLGVTVLVSSCDMLNQVISTVDTSSGKLTTDQVIQGLKEALRVGTDAAVRMLNATDGYYLDKLVKINLPPETQELLTYAKRVPGLDKLIEDVVLQINRSAEDAAKQAAPIFVSAITSMSIGDAWGILNGADTAATGYLREKTFNQLVNLYLPSVKNSLDKPIVMGVSANQSWGQLTKTWNQFAGSVAGKLLGVKQLNYTLDEYVTKQALSGMFVKVADQEKRIRTDISARTSDLLRRVFGSQS
jgi:hypothetical protein